MFTRALSISLVTLFLLVSAAPARAQFLIDPCKSTVVANAGVLMACPKGDGDFLTNAIGGTNCQITLTVKDYANQPVIGLPETDMWLVSCNNSLLICGLSSGSQADHPTDALGQTTFSHPIAAGGCTTGLWVVVEGVVIQSPGNCQPLCVPIQVRSVDYKSAGAPGPAPCAGDLLCPDSQVTNADFSWFVTHYPNAANPGASYFACADFAAPLGAPIGLGDFSKFSVHFYAMVGHKCPL
jgi:hypothetical protein